MAKMMFNAILIGGLLSMLAGTSGIAGKYSRECIISGAFLFAIIVASFVLSRKPRSQKVGLSPRFMQETMAQEKADRSEERRAAYQQQQMLMQLLQEQGRQQTEAIKQISNAVQAQASVAGYAIATLSQNNQLLIKAGARLDYDQRTESYVAQLKGQCWRVEPDEAESWAEIAPEQVNPRLLTEGDQNR
jgi:hypothetical protein